MRQLSRTIVGPGVIGESVRQVQHELVAVGYELICDGVYGQDMCEAIRHFQASNAIVPSGVIDQATWSALMRRPVPSVRERCVQMTAAFEGHGFGLAMGDFDHAMLTWGIIGFTLKSGEIQKIVKAVNRAQPDLVGRAFVGCHDELMRLLDANFADQKQWARAHTLPGGGLAEPWRTMFAKFGELAGVQAEQMKQVETDYLQPAIRTAKKLGFASEFGLALCFDIHVQNGGVGARALTLMQEHCAGEAEAERRRMLANLIADFQGGKWKEDVRARKLTIATGQGTVHGHNYRLENWGLSGEIEAEELVEERVAVAGQE